MTDSNGLKSALELAMERQIVTSESPESTPPNCNGCRFAIFKDYGYSNWTVYGTEFFCAIKKHPADGFDRFYGEDKRLDYAAECNMFRPGDAVEMDVDEENELTPEQQAIYDLWDGEPIKPPTYPGGIDESR